MSRLTDDQVAHVLAHHAADGHSQVMALLAVEVAAYRAMRPKCPQGCVNGRVNRAASNSPAEVPSWRPCPANCEDGFMPLADWVKLLIEDGKRMAKAMKHLDTCPASYGPMHRCDCGTRNVIAEHATVLKMAGDE